MPEGDAPASDATSTLPEGHPLASAVGAAAGDTETETETPTAPPAPAPSDTDHAAEAAKWKALAQKHEARAKANAAASAELEKLRQQSMTDQEKAVNAARIEGRNAALAEVGGQLVVAQLRASAAGRVDARVLDAVLARLDTAAFLTDEGQVDTDSVAAFVESIAPPAETQAPPDPRWPDLGQGQVGAPPALNDSGLERALRAVTGR